MKIERVYVIGNRHDLRYTQSCVASIRRWYPDIPMSLVKDEYCGAYDTREIERAWNVDVYASGRRRFGSPFAKLVPLLDGPPGERCLILDSDIVFVGPVLDSLEASDADFVVEARGGSAASVARDYFDLQAVLRFDPDFVFPGYTFNCGQLVTTCGLLRRSDLEPLVESRLRDHMVSKHPEIFRGGDQGILNYVVAKKAQLGEITVDRIPFMLWGPGLRRGQIRIGSLRAGSPYPYMVHWAGKKRKLLRLTRKSRLLRHFEREYHGRIRGGRRTQLARAAALTARIALRRETLAAQPPWRTRA